MKRKIENVILLVGTLITAYGATAFWWIRSLPPNNDISGGLPCLYVMGAGILAMLIGAVVRDLRISKPKKE